jgi:hypothetical protein
MIFRIKRVLTKNKCIHIFSEMVFSSIIIGLCQTLLNSPGNGGIRMKHSKFEGHLWIHICCRKPVFYSIAKCYTEIRRQHKKRRIVWVCVFAIKNLECCNRMVPFDKGVNDDRSSCWSMVPIITRGNLVILISILWGRVHELIGNMSDEY